MVFKLVAWVPQRRYSFSLGISQYTFVFLLFIFYYRTSQPAQKGKESTFLLLNNNHIFSSENITSSLPCLSSLSLKTRTNFSFFNENWLVLLENRVHLLVGVAPEDTTNLKTGRKIYYLQQVRRTQGIFPEAVTSPAAKTKAVFKLRVHADSWRGLAGLQRLNFSWLKSQGSEKVNIIIP